MVTLDIRDIDFSELEIFNGVNSTESTLFYDEHYFYKLFDNNFDGRNKEKKLLLLNDGDKIPDVVIPDILIKNNGLMSGCVMERIKDANSLSKYKNSNVFIMLLYVVSQSLKKIHSDPRNIVIGDLHFNNIIIDSNIKHHFIDIDSCMIDGISADRLPISLKHYILNRGNFKFDVSKNTDKLCLILAMISALFGKSIDSLCMDEYDDKAEQVYTLKNMRNIFVELKNNNNCIVNVPYLHELISINDFPAFKKVRKFN